MTDRVKGLTIVLEKDKQYLYDQKEDINKSCEHCWYTELMLTSNPPQYEQTCLYCDKKRIINQNINKKSFNLKNKETK